MSINWGVAEQKVVYPYNAIIFGHKNEWGPNTRYDTDESWKQYAKSKKPVTKAHRTMHWDLEGGIMYHSPFPLLAPNGQSWQDVRAQSLLSLSVSISFPKFIKQVTHSFSHGEEWVAGTGEAYLVSSSCTFSSFILVTPLNIAWYIRLFTHTPTVD